jgi:hypothetical protein
MAVGGRNCSILHIGLAVVRLVKWEKQSQLIMVTYSPLLVLASW